MVFSSGIFLFLFLPAMLVLYFNPLIKSRPFKNAVLLLASLFFYAYGEPVFVLVMVLSVAVNYLLALWMCASKDRRAKKAVLTAGIALDVGLLFVHKYLTFVVRNLRAVVGDGLADIRIALPIGISFFTFQIMSYLFDVYRGRAKVQKNILHVALYIAMFPQLIAGPIVRYETVADEIENRVETRAGFARGMHRFALGLSKKVLIANYVGLIADNLFFAAAPLSVASAWLAVFAYGLQIYFDFSGYSDMAIGLGLIFGFHFDENFRYPYAASSVTDFWRRWHISLGMWFRDYVYIPLGGNRVSKGRWVLNILAVWLLTGIWHGAEWTFLMWGLYYFVFLMAEKKWKVAARGKVCAHIYTLLVVSMGWVLFRAENLTKAISHAGMMLGIGASGLTDALFRYYLLGGKWVLLMAVIGCLPVAEALNKAKWTKNGVIQSALPVANSLFTLAVFLLALLVSVNSTYNPFIYFNF